VAYLRKGGTGRCPPWPAYLMQMCIILEILWYLFSTGILILSLWWLPYTCMPSVLWHCWLGGRKGIRLVKNWVEGCWNGYLSGVRCRLHMTQLMPLPLTVSCFSKIQIGLVSPIWYWLTQAILDKIQTAIKWVVCVWWLPYLHPPINHGEIWHKTAPKVSSSLKNFTLIMSLWHCI